MDKPKIAILGASGIGKFHAREFHDAGCDVTAILGSTKESTEKTSQNLKKQWNITARPYHDLTTLLSNEELDAVSICTPPHLHSSHVRQCLEAGLHVLCEKPFVSDSQYQNYQIAKDLVALAREKNRIISVNTQWVSAVQYIPERITSQGIQNFSMYINPVIITGSKLLHECIPHLNSMLIRLVPEGSAEDIKFLSRDEKDLKIEFKYGNCNVNYNVACKAEKPTSLGFSINGNKFDREIGENYTQFLKGENGSQKIEDPLKTSVKSFISALSGGKPPVSESEILQNMMLHDIILENYHNPK